MYRTLQATCLAIHSLLQAQQTLPEVIAEDHVCFTSVALWRHHVNLLLQSF